MKRLESVKGNLDSLIEGSSMARAADLKHYIATKQMREGAEHSGEGLVTKDKGEQESPHNEEGMKIDYYEHYQFLGKIREQLFTNE